jgi:hypothetical protein
VARCRGQRKKEEDFGSGWGIEKRHVEEESGEEEARPARHSGSGLNIHTHTLLAAWAK